MTGTWLPAGLALVVLAIAAAIVYQIRADVLGPFTAACGPLFTLPAPPLTDAELAILAAYEREMTETGDPK